MLKFGNVENSAQKKGCYNDNRGKKVFEIGMVIDLEDDFLGLK